ncbi:A disintegrin and metalloproteinase with thrombospondin motifs like [Diachasmimorpha longicaudata]|uniref:A disintegrin and metalloproteinase with thrombospondin motifs like n=1 Tax=Diachasmimorpha longicaudata TaxID=58733 RepID=UPI0030B8A243
MIRLELLVLVSFIYVLPYAKGHSYRSLNAETQNSTKEVADQSKNERQVTVTATVNSVDSTPTPDSGSESPKPGGVDGTGNSVSSPLASTLTPVWLAQGSQNGSVNFTKAANDVLESTVQLYHDRQTELTVVVIEYGPGHRHCLGMFSNYTIEIPSRYLITHRRKSYRGAAVQAEGELPATNSIIYPKLLITTAYKVTFNSTSSDEFYKHLMYILAFFNGVDLIFKQLSAPHVRLQLAGIVVGGDRFAAPYLEKKSGSSGDINATAALGKIEKFYQDSRGKNFSPEPYDIIVTLTDSDIFDEKEVEICSPKLGGVSKGVLVCSDDVVKDKAAAIIQDNLAFSGLRMAAHELGHILGAEHDGGTDEWTKTCRASDGYLMSKYNELRTVTHKWSNCSLTAFNASFQSSLEKCLDKPLQLDKAEIPLPSMLPGVVVGIHHQCQAFGFNRACIIPENCNSLTCTNAAFILNIDTDTDCVPVGVPPAQGSICGCQRHCRNGECVDN